MHRIVVQQGRMVVVVAACLLAAGCATKMQEREIVKIPHELSDSYAKHTPKKVAVLPFENALNPDDPHPDPVVVGDQVGTRRPEAIARESFYKHFSILPFEDVELHAVDAALKGATTIAERTRAASKALGVDTVVQGKLKRYYHVYVFFVAYTNVAAEVKMVNVQTGETIWSSDHYDFGGEVSIGIDVWNLFMCGYKEYIWRRELRRRFDDLFNDMVKTLPERQKQLRIGVEKGKE